jgi:hypothetical protein
MKNYTYHFEVESVVAQFMAALDDIIIKRYEDKEAKETIKVRFLYEPKQRIISDLIDKAQNLQLPVVAVTLGSVTRDSGRVYNKLDGAPFKALVNDYKNTGFMKQPLPVDINVNVDILTKYQRDMDQIITNFAPYCDPYFVISWRIPEMNNYEIRSVVLWSGTVNVTYPMDLNASTNLRVTGNTSFTIKAWLFKPIDVMPLIYNIDSTYYALSSLKNIYGFNKEDITHEEIYIHGAAKPTAVTPSVIHVRDTMQLTVYGDMFKTVQNVYLSGSSINDICTTQHPFSGAHNLSAAYPAFNAIKLPPSAYSVESENIIKINIPFNIKKGYIDIIVENLAGYNSLTSWLNMNNSKYTYEGIEPSYGVKVLT